MEVFQSSTSDLYQIRERRQVQVRPVFVLFLKKPQDLHSDTISSCLFYLLLLSRLIRTVCHLQLFCQQNLDFPEHFEPSALLKIFIFRLKAKIFQNQDHL